MTDTELHSVYAISAFSRLGNCHGSLRMADGVTIEDRNTKPREEGTACHWAAKRMLLDIPVAQGMVAPNGVEIDKDMIDTSLLYAEEIRKVSSMDLHIEEKMDVPVFHPQCYGTPDAWFFDLKRLILYIWDLKYGRIPVNPIENLSLIGYAAGVLDIVTGGKALSYNLNITVYLNIYHTRVYDGKPNLRTWKIASYDLRPYVNKIKNAIDASQLDDAPCTTGTQCTYCRGAYRCPALLKAAMDAHTYTSTDQPINPTPQQISVEMTLLTEAKRSIETRLTAMQEQAMIVGRVPNYTMQDRYGHRKWRDKNGVLEYGEMMGVDLAVPSKPVTPLQAEKKFKAAGIPESALDGMFDKPFIGKKLVFEDLREVQAKIDAYHNADNSTEKR